MKSQDLHKLQRRFKDCLDLSRYTRKDIKPLGIKETRDFKMTERFEIYHYAYFIRIYDSLCEDFPATLKHLGKRRFKTLMREYLIKHPSVYASLYETGKSIPLFLKRKKLIEASKIAEIEWLKMESAWQAEPVATDWSRLQSYANLDSIVFELHPSVRLLKQGVYYLIHRKNFKTVVKKIKKEEFLILKAIQAGQPVSTFSKAVPRFKESEMYAFFFSLMTDHLLVSFRHIQ